MSPGQGLGYSKAVAGVQRTPFSANRKAMASEALWGAAAGTCKHSEGCSRELCEAKIAWRPTVSLLISTRRSSGLLTHCVCRSQRCRAGGRRPAGEHDAENLRRPPRRLSGAALCHW
eukprot:3186293-Prymnesium_polylepis.1